jgi:hypothetical protein
LLVEVAVDMEVLAHLVVVAVVQVASAQVQD